MTRCRKLVYIVGGVCLAVVARAPAQEAGASACDALDELRDGAPTSRDHKTLDDCIRELLDHLAEAASNPLTIDQGVTDFLEAFNGQYRHENNSVAFKEKFAQRSVELLHAELGKGRQLQAEAARALARALASLDSVRTREALLAGLQHPDQVVRFLCAKGLTSIRESVGADALLTRPTLGAIGQAGKGEINGVVVAMMYRAAMYDNHPKESVEAMLAILDGRLDLLRRLGKGFDRAELPAIAFLAALANDDKLTGALKAEVVRRLAPLLRIHTQRYVQVPVPETEKEAIKDTIYETESLLRKIVSPDGPAPDVSGKMQKGNEGAEIEMELELLLWVGAKQGEGDAGVLNQSPWNVDRGAP